MKQAAEQSDGDALVTLANEIGTYTPQTCVADAARRLMGLTKKFVPHRTREVAQILILAATPAYAPYAVMIAALDAAAPLEPGIEAFLANRQKAKAVLQAALAAIPDAEAMSQKLRIRLARTLWQMGDEEGLADLVGEVASRAKQGKYDHIELAKLALIYMNTQHGRILREAVGVVVKCEPNSLELLHAHVRGLVADRQPIEAWWPRLKQSAIDYPEDAGLKRFIASCAYKVGEWGFVEELQQGDANALNTPTNWENAGLAALRMGHEERAIEWLSRVRPRVPPQRVGPLAPILESLIQALNRDYHFGAGRDHRKLQDALAASLAELKRELSSNEYAPNHLVQAAAAIGTVERYPFYVLSELVAREMYVDHWDERYGTFDLPAYGIVWRALVEHQVVLFEKALQRLLNGAEPGSLNAVREIAEGLTEVRLALDEPEAAMRHLKALTDAGCNTLFFDELLDQCLLHRGNVAEVQTRVEMRSSMCRRRVNVCAVAEAAEWIEREQLTTTVLWEEGPFEGDFEKASNDGQIDAYKHQLRPFTLRAVEASSLTLAGSEVLIGPRGTALRPSHWHYRGMFPERTGIALSASVGGAVLDLSGPIRQIDEPVVVLACNDAVHVTNYYHWINFVLTRCVFLLEQGLLKTRRLLMPAELQPWMRGALELVGLTEDRLVSYNACEVVHIADATVTTGFDYPGTEYLRRFRSFMWNAAKANSDSAQREMPVHVFMSRPTDSRRPFFGRDRILQIAQDEGFQCIDPAGLSVDEQVRLFANAGSVAGFGGAAFTNMAFCPPGMPALELTRRETTWPDYTGIALALGIRYRFCPGWIEPCANGTPRVHDAPTRFDEAMVSKQLKWLKEVTE